MTYYNADWAISAVGPKNKEEKISFYRSHIVWGENESSYLGKSIDISRDKLIRKIDEEKKQIITVREVGGEMVPGEIIRVTKEFGLGAHARRHTNVGDGQLLSRDSHMARR